MISGITLAGDLLLMVQERSYRSPDVVRFLRHLLRHLPGYAPDPNPDEGIWNYLKRVELRNRCCSTLGRLRRELRLAMARLRHKRQVIQGCIRPVG